MAGLIVPVASSIFTSGLLTLVLPLAVLIIITIWYVVLWRGDLGQP